MYVPRTITLRNRCGLSSMLEWKLWLVRRRGDRRARSISGRKRAASISCTGDISTRMQRDGGGRKAAVREPVGSKVIERRPGNTSRLRMGLDFKFRENALPLHV